jgi:hypothetical protein
MLENHRASLGEDFVANDAATVDARTPASQPRVAPLREEDLPEAARIIRVAFGTFLGASDPENFWTDRDYAFGRHPPVTSPRSVRR